MSDDLVKQALVDRIEEHDAAFTNLHREYDRRGDRIEELEAKLLSATMDGYDMAKHEYRDRIEELEAKRVKAVNFIVFLDENYRHAFGVTARQKIRELYVELKGEKDD